MCTVPVASREGAREPYITAGSWLRLARPGKRVQGLESVPVRAHVHPEVGVTAEALAADIAEVHMLREQFFGIELNDIIATVALGGFSGEFFGGGGRGRKLLDRSRSGRRWRWSEEGKGGREEVGSVEDDEVSGG